MSSKHRLIGRIAFAPDPSKSQVYWKCPTRGCAEIHYFIYAARVSGTTSIYKKTCSSCQRTYTASMLNVTGTSVLLASVFDGE